MTAQQVVNRLITEEMNPKREADGRRILCTERMTLQGTMAATGEPRQQKAASIAKQMAEAVSVAQMWGVDFSDLRGISEVK